MVPVDEVMHIGQAARVLRVTLDYLRALERAKRIPVAPRDYNGRTYTEADIALLRKLGIGLWPRRLRSVSEVLEEAG